LHLCAEMRHTVEIKRKAHYYTQKPAKEPRSILYVLHGYGQLAEEFIKEFHFLRESSTIVVAPEAISKFYNKERKAVANWMTSHERIDEIDDYINFLNSVHEEIRSQHEKLPIAVLGFSQGVSTAFRWMCESKLDVDVVFTCSGTIPPELTLSDFSSLKETPCYYYFGNRDKLLLPEKALKQIELLRNVGLNITQCEYEGRHEISEITAKDIKVFSQSY